MVDIGYMEILNVEMELEMGMLKEGQSITVFVEPKDCIAFKI